MYLAVEILKYIRTGIELLLSDDQFFVELVSQGPQHEIRWWQRL